jgi:hypothetical protein
MTTVTHTVGDAVEHASTSDYLEALHHFQYSVTIQSPRTSPNGLFMVSAYGFEGGEPEMFRESRPHLHDAIKAVAFKLGAGRLSVYVNARSLTGELG